MVISTDADEAEALPPLAVYPNPANDRLFVEMPEDLFGSGQVVLMDMFGRVQQRMDAGCYQCEMDLNGLSAGVYFLVWEGENGGKSKQTAFVKQ